jgi:hypothetical protein
LLQAEQPTAVTLPADFDNGVRLIGSHEFKFASQSVIAEPLVFVRSNTTGTTMSEKLSTPLKATGIRCFSVSGHYKPASNGRNDQHQILRKSALFFQTSPP